MGWWWNETMRWVSLVCMWIIKHLGTGGVATFVYNVMNGRYMPCDESHDPAVPPENRVSNTVFDDTCWLEEQELFD